MENNKKTLHSKWKHLLHSGDFEFPEIQDVNKIPKGDMPGDKIEIETIHVTKAQKIFRELINQIIDLSEKTDKVVISVHGGSGVGKSEIGSLLAYYMNYFGIGSYVLSGDNYPLRIPKYNDAERLRIYRAAAIQALVESQLFDTNVRDTMLQLQKDSIDADPLKRGSYPWLEIYQKAGKEALISYLGGPAEINFDEINRIISKFKKGESTIMLKRMGRTEDSLWYDRVNMKEVQILVIEWTHGNNVNLQGVDIPILLNSTPEETLEHRRKRNRDGGLDSPFTTLILELEQVKLAKQAGKAQIIVTKNGDIITYDDYCQLNTNYQLNTKKQMNIQPMLNVYPDSLGSHLSDVVQFLEGEKVKDSFNSIYLLPSIFNSDLDRGFSVIDYNINESLGTKADLEKLVNMGIKMKFDIVLNHASVLSEQFQDVINKGIESKYIDFFIDWNKFWQGYGEMTQDGYIQPDKSVIEPMFFRKPGLPILSVRMPDGTQRPFWNTFYQEIKDEIIDSETKRTYLGQMDLNVKSPLVWEFYDETLQKLANYGADIVRLDAFAYTSKEPGEKNFFNEPGTWEILEKVDQLAKKYSIELLPEIHTKYEEKVHEQISDKGYMIYDFFLPGLIIDAFEEHNVNVLMTWANEIIDKDFKTVNMLGCHDGIPVLDLKGLLSEERIEKLIQVIVDRGGMVKDLHGKKNIYYQVNASYYSALGENDAKMLLARAIQLFMPGKPQVWYYDLFCGKNDYAAVIKAGTNGHKEINRRNLTLEEINEGLRNPVVIEQLRLLKLRNTHPAFNQEAKMTVTSNNEHTMTISWSYGKAIATLIANLENYSYKIIE